MFSNIHSLSEYRHLDSIFINTSSQHKLSISVKNTKTLSAARWGFFSRIHKNFFSVHTSRWQYPQGPECPSRLYFS